MNRIIARTSEIDTLERKFNSGKSEFVIVYGRRRIGKTFLVNNVFADRLTFAYVGARKQKPKKQLQRFAEQLKAYSGSPFAPVLANWDEAFQALRTLIESKPKETRKVVFFDEMPWIDTPRSSFVEALEYFWNAWAAQRNDILFIACGSATSWMVNKLVKNKGGIIESQNKSICGLSDWVNVKNTCTQTDVFGTDTPSFSAIWPWAAFHII